MFNTKKEMKAKLITDGKNNYSLLDYNNELIGTTMESMITDQKLSKQNCDEIFGVINVENLADEYFLNEYSFNGKNNLPYKDSDIQITKNDFRNGFNKAMELNKDKVFTLEDMGNLWDFCTYNKGTFAEFIQSIQQPTEIEVEIEMDDIWDGLDSTRIFPKEETSFPNLDPNGCLILKKI